MRLQFLGLAACAIVVFTSCKNNSYDLKFRPEGGAKYEVLMTTNSLTGQDVMGNKIEVKSLTEMVMLYDIEKEGNTTSTDKTINVTFKSMKSTETADGKETVTDTNNADTSNAVSNIMRALMGAQFVVTLNAKGEVTEVKGMDALISKMMGAANNTDTTMRTQMIEGIKNFMSDDIIKNMMEQSFEIFPDAQVKTGDSWKKSMVITKPLPMNIETKFTLDKVNGAVAKLTVASVITPGKGGMEVMGTTVETELSGTQSGNIDVDIETGMTIAADIKQNISGNMKAMGQEIPMSINSVITVKMKKI